MDSFDWPPAVSPFSYVPAMSQATYRLRSRLRSSQEGILRGFDRGFWGKGSRAGNPTMAKGYGQSPSAMLCKALHCYAWHCYAMQSVERAGAEWGDEAPYTLGRPEGGGSAPTPESAGIRLLLGGTSLSRRVPPRPRSPLMAWRAATLARSMRRTCRKASSASVYISVDMGATVQLQGNSTWATRVLRGNLG
jgi:hypothetical protein